MMVPWFLTNQLAFEWGKARQQKSCLLSIFLRGYFAYLMTKLSIIATKFLGHFWQQMSLKYIPTKKLISSLNFQSWSQCPVVDKVHFSRTQKMIAGYSGAYSRPYLSGKTAWAYFDLGAQGCFCLVLQRPTFKMHVLILAWHYEKFLFQDFYCAKYESERQCLKNVLLQIFCLVLF